MTLALTVWRSAAGYRWRLALAFLATSLSPVLILAVISEIIQHPDEYNVTLMPMVIFALAAFGVVGGNAYTSRLSSRIVEATLDRIRRNLADTVRQIEYDDFERFGGRRIYDTLTRNSAVISEAAMVVMPSLAAAASVVLAGLYALTLSTAVFAAMVVVMAAGGFFFRISQRRTREQFIAAAMRETEFLNTFSNLLDGYKEVRLNDPRGDDLEERHLVPASVAYRDARILTVAMISRGMSVFYGAFYLLLGTIAFVLPPYVDSTKVVLQSFYVTYFLLALTEVVVKSIPLVARADYALSELSAVEGQLVSAARPEPSGGRDLSGFSEIALDAATFNYRDPQGTALFTVGPVTLRIARGETVFIVGGNGSGKSTLLRMLCRLYRADSGRIMVDGRPVGSADAAAYRNLFTAVFTDFHLFDRLYGLGDVDEAEVNRMLGELGIGEKVRLADGRFTTTALSTGQRKRLALAVALLERRPVLILDELAADQDPAFRRRFYDEIIPGLRAEGRTLLVVSHDDRYHGTADRVVALRDGQLVDVAPERAEAP